MGGRAAPASDEKSRDSLTLSDSRQAGARPCDRKPKREDETVCAKARRDGLRSFQIGLAHGVAEKLKIMKAERDAALRQSSGRDLVPLKASVIDDELDKLGYSFSKKALRRKRVVPGAYEAGREAGRKFEPRRGIEEADAA
ncbi:MAG TPA: hypothetical protein VEH76_00025 [Methylocystis sp.]|nr:hypothetical protein [Methylocystis sp.]